MIPLFHEPEIADALIKRLENLTYPKPLLDIILVLEAADEVTRTAIERTQLPSWIKVVVVPDAKGLTTKPRAMNYALDFCRGTIIGVWDAEDAPEPDQIEKVAARFNEAAPNVVCLQGMLDYYNARQNWISRFFTIEYATWWRVVLPGMARLGFVIPLGGTTLFFRRNALEKLGRWDAHNVTEDADLGVRLARHGYVTELIPTVTYEEANCRRWRWVRQRSRWLKGFMITYIVHMRDPAQLLRDLGFKRFMGLQMIFLATFSQFLFAPVLWSFWITIFGYHHPIQNVLGDSTIQVLILLFFFGNPEYDHGYDSRHITKSPPLAEMGGNNATLFHTRPTGVLQGAVRNDRDPVLLGQDRAWGFKRDVIYGLLAQQLTFFLAPCRVLL
jgi:cellulose synthase/poly-beta-1,6-N-acetylglucosamine synthase-like glycosyltransferase